MREILFKGKRVDDNKWIEGYFYKIWDRVFLLWGMTGDSPNMEKVIPETVSQYTGLKDKNGKKIFEGDIVEFTNKYIHNTGLAEKGRAKIVFEAFKWKYSGCYYGGNPIVWLCIDDTSIEFEVIGNIYDNPELLEV